MEKNKLQELTEAGFTQRAIAKRLGLSHTTIRYWLGKYGLKTQGVKHRPKRHEGDTRYITSLCSTHGETSFIYEASKKGYRCRACRSGRVTNERRGLKKALVDYLGGKCTQCGYDKSSWSMHFHHNDPNTKTFTIGDLIRNRKRDLAFEEIEKCVLVCANCHGEIEEVAASLRPNRFRMLQPITERE